MPSELQGFLPQWALGEEQRIFNLRSRGHQLLFGRGVDVELGSGVDGEAEIAAVQEVSGVSHEEDCEADEGELLVQKHERCKN